jgi:hypothetical protein
MVILWTIMGLKLCNQCQQCYNKNNSITCNQCSNNSNISLNRISFTKIRISINKWETNSFIKTNFNSKIYQISNSSLITNSLIRCNSRRINKISFNCQIIWIIFKWKNNNNSSNSNNSHKTKQTFCRTKLSPGVILT